MDHLEQSRARLYSQPPAVRGSRRSSSAAGSLLQRDNLSVVDRRWDEQTSLRLRVCRAVSSGSVKSLFFIELSSCGIEPPGKSVLPIEPANNTSPTNTFRSLAS